MEATIQQWVRDGARQRNDAGRRRSGLRHVGRVAVDSSGRVLRSPEVMQQQGAVLHGFTDVVSMGQGADIEAALRTIGQSGPISRIGDRYRRNQEAVAARDARDRRQYGSARAVGQALGVLALARGAYEGGVGWSASLPSKAKGNLGEFLSWARTFTRGDIPIGAQVRVPLRIRHTVADFVTRSGDVIEAKFGPTARLTGPQRRALQELGSRYRYEHWMPYHVGRIGAVAGTAAGAGAAVGTSNQDETQSRRR